MKKIVLLFIITISFQAFAQKHEHRERIRALKTAFITEKLDLTSSEAEKFWPIYNAYDKKMHELQVTNRRKFRKKIVTGNNEGEISEKQAKDILSEMLENDSNIAKAKIELKNNLQKVISNVKILKLFKAEHEFSKKLLREYRSKRKNKH